MNQLKPGAHIHLMGVCGTAMGSLAGILKSMGYRVTGSDQNVYPPMSTQLERLGIRIMQGYRRENLDPRPDLVIVGNVISKGFEEAEALLASDIPYTSLPRALGEFVIAQRHSVVIAGTHGKTTTTAMVSWLLDVAGRRPGFLIGGIPLNFEMSFRKSESDWFVIEGDEYDTAFFDKVPKFVHYRPRSVILTSVEFDHADIYRDLDHVKEAFRSLIRLIPNEGLLVACADDVNVRDLLSEARCRVVTYGTRDADYSLGERQALAGRNHFGVFSRGQNVGDAALKLFGVHNSLNALASFALCRELGFSTDRVLQGLADFKGVKRRQEVIGVPGGVTVIEDFAHHPTAVRLTIDSIKEGFSGKKVFAVFEPRSATSRRKIFQADYVKAFSQADVSLIMQPYDQSRLAEAEKFSSQDLVADIRHGGRVAEVFDSVDGIVEHLRRHARSGDAVLIMSNGGFGGIYAKVLAALGK
jgi:UDP-N-acetylmuramate: L-alanyl-gamma-D-glutamyl-meso-diaminopimelate ligase